MRAFIWFEKSTNYVEKVVDGRKSNRPSVECLYNIYAEKVVDGRKSSRPCVEHITTYK